MKNLLKTIIVLSLTLICAIAHAGEPFRVNVAKIPIPDQSPQTLKAKLPIAMAQVMVKMSGNPKITLVPAIRDSLPKAKRWIIAYSYQNSQDANGNPQLVLQVVFQRTAMENLLRNAGQKIWDSNRPSPLVWLHVKKDSLNYFLSGNDHGEISIGVKNHAFRRGIPYRVPLMDMQDQQLLDRRSANPFTQDRLEVVAKRYDADGVLAGDLSFGEDQTWKGDWHLFLNGVMTIWNNSGHSIDEVIGSAIDRLADLMVSNSEKMGNQMMANGANNAVVANINPNVNNLNRPNNMIRNNPNNPNPNNPNNPSNDNRQQMISETNQQQQNSNDNPQQPVSQTIRYQQQNNQSQPDNETQKPPKIVRMAVFGVNNLDNYAKLMKYLQGLSPVTGVTVDDMTNSILLLDLNTKGGQQALVEALQNDLNPLIAALPPPEDPATVPADLYYHWVTSDEMPQNKVDNQVMTQPPISPQDRQIMTGTRENRLESSNAGIPPELSEPEGPYDDLNDPSQD